MSKKTSPIILLVGLTYVVFINCNICLQTILLDFAADKDVEVHMAVYLLSAFAVFDIVGRLSVGLISDKGLLSRSMLMGCATILFGCIMQLLPFANGFWKICFLCMVVGYALGTSVVLVTVLVGDYAGDISKISVIIGWMAFFAGITGLTRPWLIGEKETDSE